MTTLRPTAILSVLALSLTGCAARLDATPSQMFPTASATAGEGMAGEWGPLAVSREFLGGDFARNAGVLMIGASCVVVRDGNGDAWQLLWAEGRTTWNDQSRTLAFQNLDGEVIEVRDGDNVVLGGSGQIFSDPLDPESVDWATWKQEIEWVAEPREECATRAWAVGSLGLGS